MLDLEVKEIFIDKENAGEIILGASSELSHIELYDDSLIMDRDIISVNDALYRFDKKTGLFQSISDIEINEKPIRSVRLIPRFAVVVLSDSCYKGTATDKSGLFITSHLEESGFYPDSVEVIPDEKKDLLSVYKELIRENINLIITTGGTGLYNRDITPDTTREFVEKEIWGLSQAIIAHGLTKTPMAMLGRIFAGSISRTMIINLPGSLKSVSEAFEVISPQKNNVLRHALEKLAGSKQKCGE